MANSMIRIPIYITQEQINWLLEMKNETGASMAWLIREAIEHYRKQEYAKQHAKYGRTQSGPLPGQAKSYLVDVDANL